MQLFAQIRHKGIYIFLIVSVIFPLRVSKSCGFQIGGFSGYSFLQPNLIDENISSYHSFLCFDDIYTDGFRPKKDSIYQEQVKDENLWEWRKKFCDYADLSDVRYIIYQAPSAQIEGLLAAAQSKHLGVDSRLAENEFATQLRDNRCVETIQYLLFAKKCEPFVAEQDAWSPKSRDKVAIQMLMNEGKNSFMQTKSPFIKLRYAFQTMRLAHYSGNYQETVNLYNNMMPMIDKRVQSVAHYWILSLKAGALKHLGQYAESAYLFSVVFQGCLSKRDAAIRSFEIQNDAQFQQALLLCRTDKEKATLYAMRGYADDAKAVEEMQLIYDLDPKNEHLETLLLREIRKSERDLLGLAFNDRRRQNQAYHHIPRPAAGEYAIRLNNFIVKCIKEGKVRNPELWLVADGYMELIRGDFYAAQNIFSKIKDNLKSKNLKNQVSILETIAEIHGFERIDNETEEKISDIIDSPLYKQYPDLPDFLFDKIASLYEKAGMKGRAFRCHYEIEAMKPNPQLDIIDDLLTLSQKTGKNALERSLVTDKRGNSIEDELWEMKAVTLLANNQMEAALECFKKVSNERLERSKYNPFETRTKECIHCPPRDASKLLTRKEIVARIIDLQYQSKADYENAATYLYKLGVAFYNMSYYGHAWGVKDFYRSGTSWHRADRNYSDEHTAHYYPFGNKEYTDMSIALRYFERAYEIAQEREPELAARCAFWAARCQQKQYFDSDDFRQTAYGFLPKLPDDYRQYYQQLAKYKQTEYYDNIIKECSYFQHYRK